MTRHKLQLVPLTIDILVVLYLALSLWLVYRGDVLGYTKIFDLVPATLSGTKVFLLLYNIRLFIFSIIYCVFITGLYFLKKWAFIGLLILNLITLVTAEPWIRGVTFFAVIYLVFQREYFNIGEFKRPEFKDIIHVDLLAGEKTKTNEEEERTDLKIEEFLANNEIDNAAEYTQGLIAIAKHMADTKNLIFYEKYMEKINRIKNRTII
ncbi:MAG: hypothetical protein HY920_00060 [Elusimicrobia bacterium]|nr:hypothetical protein [Elusimicrobiota bacterium]